MKLEAERETKLKTVKDMLLAKGVRLKACACGCCGSPEIKIEIDENIIFDESGIDINMFREQ